MNELNKPKARCGSCGRYPFCKTTKGASDCCEKWIKRDYNTKIQKY